MADSSIASKVLAVAGRLFIAAIVAVAPEVSLNAISKYVRELITKNRHYENQSDEVSPMDDGFQPLPTASRIDNLSGH